MGPGRYRCGERHRQGAGAVEHPGVCGRRGRRGAVVAGGGAYLYTRRRREQEAKAQLESLREASDELTVDQLATQSIETLDDWSKEVLTDTDNAVRTSAEELRLAVDEFGEQDTAPFRTAVRAAKKGVAESFVLRQRLDDAIEESAEQRRSMLIQIITTCHDVDGALDEQVRAFDELRNLLLGAPDRLDDLTRSIVDLATRAETAEATLALLIAKHGEDRVQAVAHNVELAEKQISFAQENVHDGREATQRPAGRQGAAVAAIRAAEGAVAQAGKLLDAIANADTSIAQAATRLPALIEEVTAELAEAATLDSTPSLAEAAGAAKPPWITRRPMPRATRWAPSPRWSTLMPSWTGNLRPGGPRRAAGSAMSSCASRASRPRRPRSRRRGTSSRRAAVPCRPMPEPGCRRPSGC